MSDLADFLRSNPLALLAVFPVLLIVGRIAGRFLFFGLLITMALGVTLVFWSAD